MKLTTDRRSRSKASRHSKHRRRTSRTYATAVPLAQRPGGLLGSQSSPGTALARPLSGVASAGSRVLAFLLALSMTGALVWFFMDYRFFVYGIAVDDAGLVSAEDVYHATGLDEMSIFYVNRARAADQVCERLPAVERASVSCTLPARVEVKVWERLGAYRWYSGGYTYLVDKEGRVLGLDDGLHQDVIAIYAQDNGPLTIGDRVDPSVLKTVHLLCALLPEADVFQYSEAMGVSLSGEGGLTVYFGDEQDLQAKVGGMKAMLREIADKGDSAQFIDVRFVSSPYYR